MNKVNWREVWLRSVIIVCLGIAGFTICSGFSGCNTPSTIPYRFNNEFKVTCIGYLDSDEDGHWDDQALYVTKIGDDLYFTTMVHGGYVIGPKVSDTLVKEFKKDLEF